MPMLTRCPLCGGELIYRGKEGQLILYHCPTCVANINIHEDYVEEE